MPFVAGIVLSCLFGEMSNSSLNELDILNFSVTNLSFVEEAATI